MILVALAAQEAPAACGDPMSQSEMTQCAMAEWRRADAALNRQWGETLAKARALDRNHDPAWDKRPGYEAALLEAQRAWLRFRDAHCETEGYIMRGGSAEPMMVGSCKANLTRARTRQLAELAESY